MPEFSSSNTVRLKPIAADPVVRTRRRLNIIDFRSMNLTKREFLQVLGAASVAGMALARYAEADAATAQPGLYDLPRFGNVSSPALHRLPRAAAADPLSRAERQPRRRRDAGPAAAPGRRAPAEACRHRARHARARTHSPTSTSSRRRGTTARSAASRTSRRWSSSCRRSRPGALLLDGGDTWQGSATSLWTDGAGHGRCLQAARRRRDDRRTGNSPTARSA